MLTFGYVQIFLKLLLFLQAADIIIHRFYYIIIQAGTFTILFKSRV